MLTGLPVKTKIFIIDSLYFCLLVTATDKCFCWLMAMKSNLLPRQWTTWLKVYGDHLQLFTGLVWKVAVLLQEHLKEQFVAPKYISEWVKDRSRLFSEPDLLCTAITHFAFIRCSFCQDLSLSGGGSPHMLDSFCQKLKLLQVEMLSMMDLRSPAHRTELAPESAPPK